MIEHLEQTGSYRVLRRLQPGLTMAPGSAGARYTGIVLDVETTGLDTSRDEIIELGMVKFTFTETGALAAIGETFSGFQQPGRPVPAEITEITGITNAMVAGQSISPNAVAAFAADASLIIAHNAGFDRRMAERVWPCFMDKHWGCSASQVNWRAEGLAGSKLGYILTDLGYFHEAHRAVDDCQAALHVLTCPLPRSGSLALSQILHAASQSTVRIWAERAPYEQKDILKARGYRWSDGSGGSRKAWWIEVPAAGRDAELAYLHTNIYGYVVNLPAREITSRERFSDRI